MYCVEGLTYCVGEDPGSSVQSLFSGGGSGVRRPLVKVKVKPGGAGKVAVGGSALSLLSSCVSMLIFIQPVRMNTSKTL